MIIQSYNIRGLSQWLPNWPVVIVFWYFHVIMQVPCRCGVEMWAHGLQVKHMYAQTSKQVWAASVRVDFASRFPPRPFEAQIGRFAIPAEAIRDFEGRGKPSPQMEKILEVWRLGGLEVWNPLMSVEQVTRPCPLPTVAFLRAPSQESNGHQPVCDRGPLSFHTRAECLKQAKL